MRARWPTRPAPADRAAADREGWRHWFREDFLRSCFVGACLAWLGFGALSVRYALDPYRPNQGPAPLPVYLAILGFIVASVIGQVYMYRRWWPPVERRDETPSAGIRPRGGESKPSRDTRSRSLLLGSRLASLLRRLPPP